MKRNGILIRLAAVTAAVLCGLLPFFGHAETPEEVITEEIILDETGETEKAEEPENPAREAFIDDIIALGEKLYKQAKGKLQRAHYKEDIYSGGYSV